MRIFVAGASGAIGQPLIAELIRRGHMSESEARMKAGEDGVYYGTKLRGASNAKAKKLLGFSPRGLEFLSHS